MNNTDRGFIFDLDGTLIDNMMIHHHAWQRQLSRLGLELSIDEVRQTIHGKNNEILGRLFGVRFSDDERREIAAEKELHYRILSEKQLRPIHGFESFMKNVKSLGVPVGIGTAGPPENVRHGLQESGLRHFFDVIIDSSQVQKGKPDPEVFQNVAADIGVPLGQCLVFEDSPIGVATAMNAGCKAVVVTTTHRREEFEQYANVVKFIRDYTEISVEEALGFI